MLLSQIFFVLWYSVLQQVPSVNHTAMLTERLWPSKQQKRNRVDNGHNIDYNPQKQIQKLATEKLMEEGINCNPFVLFAVYYNLKGKNWNSTEKNFFLFIQLKNICLQPHFPVITLMCELQ
jgi:hypothetical protein